MGIFSFFQNQLIPVLRKTFGIEPGSVCSARYHTNHLALTPPAGIWIVITKQLADLPAVKVSLFVLSRQMLTIKHVESTLLTLQMDFHRCSFFHPLHRHLFHLHRDVLCSHRSKTNYPQCPFFSGKNYSNFF